MHFLLIWLAVGVGFGTALGFLWPLGIILAVIGAGAAMWFWPKSSLALFLGCVVGWARVVSLPLFAEPVPLSSNTLIHGVVYGNPHVRVDHQQVILDRKILVRAPLYPSMRAGDRVELSCTLEEPTAFGEFRYDLWLKRHHISATCAFPRIHSVEHQPASGIVTRLARISSWVSERISRALPEPEAGFARALVLGEQSAMSDETRQDFRKTGTSHIVALSGFNVTIILSFVSEIGKRLRIRFSRVASVSAVLIVLFVVMTGAEASLVRASLMGIVVLLGKLVGRRSLVPALLAFTAMMMVLINPYVLLYDAGFQLSFLATLGLYTMSEKCEQALSRLPNMFLLRGSLATTLAAMIPTTPLIALTFKTLSLISPVANVIILPVIPFAMACVAVVALVPHPVIAFPAYTVLHLTLATVRVLAKIPGSSLTF